MDKIILIFSPLISFLIVRIKKQYILFLIMFIYNVGNVLAASVILNKETSVILMILIESIIFANMYLLYSIKVSYERDHYKLQIEMMNQQEKLQYENYEAQREKYTESMSILHDVDKHIKMIEQLYRDDIKKVARDYTKQINEILRPLVPIQYTNNPIMNCLLSDKYSVAQTLGIKFYINVLTADINFMKPIDITTLFGNLIDNSISACEKCSDKRYINLYVKGYNDMISIRVENSIAEPLEIRKGKIVDRRKESRGIGILNIQRCLDEYEGNMIYRKSDNSLICDIILNRVDVSPTKNIDELNCLFYIKEY